jgi:hypothetical protein
MFTRQVEYERPRNKFQEQQKKTTQLKVTCEASQASPKSMQFFRSRWDLDAWGHWIQALIFVEAGV